MIDDQAKGSRHILITLIIAMALTVLPLPGLFVNYSPEWVALVLLYWIMALPYRIGISAAWLSGICLDILKGALLGQHALALTVIAFLMLNLSFRIRFYPLWQQSIMIGILLFIYHTLLLWIYDMTGTIEINWTYWSPVFVGALIWPGIFVMLRHIRRRYQVS